MSTSMITATAWVPRGYAAAFPTKYVFDEDEYGRIAKLAKLQLDDAQEDLAEAQEGANGENGTNGDKSGAKNDDLKEYNLDDYDKEEEEEEAEGETDILGTFGTTSLSYHESNKEDPYITIPDDEDEDDEREDLQIMPTDNLLLAAKIEDEVAHLEVYVYEDDADNMYVHHDIMLPDIPICTEWLDIPVNKPSIAADSKANFAAIGTMGPDIEIWDLDVVDGMYPSAILGPNAGQSQEMDVSKKKNKKKSRKINDEYHVDAVVALAANRKVRNLLASASADTTIKLWDLYTTKCAKSYSHHTDKVCALAWHPTDATVLLSGSYDKTVVAADMRAPDAKAPRWPVESDVESVKWDPYNEHHFYVTTESGCVHHHDARNAPSDLSKSKALWTLQAHDEAVSAFDVNKVIPGFLVTGSTNKQVKLWNIRAEGPSMVVSRDLGVGKVFSTSFAPDAQVGFRLAVAGSKGAVQIWDTSTNAAVRRIFADRVGTLPAASKGERLISVQDGGDEDDSEEGENEEGGVELDGDGNGDEGWEDDEDDDMQE